MLKNGQKPFQPRSDHVDLHGMRHIIMAVRLSCSVWRVDMQVSFESLHAVNTIFYGDKTLPIRVVMVPKPPVLLPPVLFRATSTHLCTWVSPQTPTGKRKFSKFSRLYDMQTA